MLIRLFYYPILLILLWNLVPGVAEFSHGRAHQEAVQKELFAEVPSANGLPCKQDCDNESCPDHVCHFGHCQIFAPNLDLSLHYPVVLFFHFNEAQSFESILSPPLQRPPHSFPSAA